MNCPECGERISLESSVCAHCGCAISAKVRKSFSDLKMSGNSDEPRSDSKSDSGTRVMGVANVVAALLVIGGIILAIVSFVAASKLYGGAVTETRVTAIITAAIYFVAAWVSWAILTAIGEAAHNTFLLQEEQNRPKKQISELVEMLKDKARIDG